jgi:CHAT domain-containing protein
VGFAPAYSSALSKIRFFQSNNFNPGQLTHNIQEVLDVSANFDGKTFLRNAATEKAFRTMAGNGNVLHLSMHAFTNDQEPSFSALIFAPGDSLISSDEEDGVLYLHELYDVSLKANLAVLSACETGSGRYAKGEGIMSLGRAFCYAGCENILMSLWKANDNSTSEIMKVFFKNLNEGMDKDEALRQSKLSFINASKNKFFTHPYYWSAFIFNGDPEPIHSFSVFTKGNMMFMGLSVILLGIVVVLVVRKRKALQH